MLVEFYAGKLNSKLKLGNYEMRAKLPNGRGLGHAFWLIGDALWLLIFCIYKFK